MHGKLEAICYFSHSLPLSQSFFLFSISSIHLQSQHLPLTLSSSEPLAVINLSIVILTAEHARYACLFRVEELITTFQQGPYRHEYTVHDVTQLVKFMQMRSLMNSFVGSFVFYNTY